MTVKEHYDKHLADFYSWMVGNFDKEKESFKNFCIHQEIKPNKTGVAIDLGAGNGIQSIALGEIGYKVKAVDFNDKLLQELKDKTDELAIELIKGDIRDVRTIFNSLVDLIICCGDTISHLETFEQLDMLIQDCFNLLDDNGYLILTFRDYSFELIDTQRFIPVKSDENRILTCVIDYFDDKISVTDLLYEKQDGIWVQKISSYDKLRIRTEYVIDKAEKIGFTIIKNENKNGMIHLILRK
ncbi:class I SAM-dependent methyltransferase [uncultured Aquimarina sp.]|uniref:class I SAM-dependent methyltransferase n=1 Tax=uncultured Aquimarina sp. TaxID=575652 RepID=UPI002628F979|nr:class I SAM-dependent methyltransferase [uncultured Aquimarina sp.]